MPEARSTRCSLVTWPIGRQLQGFFLLFFFSSDSPPRRVEDDFDVIDRRSVQSLAPVDELPAEFLDANARCSLGRFVVVVRDLAPAELLLTDLRDLSSAIVR